MVADQDEHNKVKFQLINFHYAKEIFGCDAAQTLRKKLALEQWWDSYED